MKCRYCQGRGEFSGPSVRFCPRCNGTGESPAPVCPICRYPPLQCKCPMYDPRGKAPDAPAPVCDVCGREGCTDWACSPPMPAFRSKQPAPQAPNALAAVVEAARAWYLKRLRLREIWAAPRRSGKRNATTDLLVAETALEAALADLDGAK